MATESLASVRTIAPSPELKKQLEDNKWVCDYETLRALWEAQSICRLIDEAMDNPEHEKQVVQLSVQGVERLLAAAISRAGWSGAGWEERK
jgi:hypothetical protein